MDTKPSSETASARFDPPDQATDTKVGDAAATDAAATDAPASEAPTAEAKVAEMIEEGDDFRKAEQFDDAIRVLLDALEVGVSQASVYFRLGNVYYDMGDMSRAEYAYRRAIECDENHASAHHNLSVVYKRTGRISESVKYRKKAYRLEMANPKGLDLDFRRSGPAALRRRSLLITAAILTGVVLLFQLL